MQIRPRLEAVIEDMLDGHIMLDEALEEFEKLYIQKAYNRNKKRITHTADMLSSPLQPRQFYYFHRARFAPARCTHRRE